MAQVMKLSVNTPDGQNRIVTVHSNHTFKDFKEKLKRDYNLFINIDDFKVFDQDLKESDNFYNCLYSNLNAADLVNIETSPMYEINLQYSNLALQENNSGFLMENLMILNDGKSAEYTNILPPNIYCHEEYQNSNDIVNESQQNMIESYNVDMTNQAQNSKPVELQLLKNNQNTYSVVMAANDPKTVALQMLKNNDASYSVVMETNNQLDDSSTVGLQLLKNDQNSYSVVMASSITQDQILQNNGTSYSAVMDPNKVALQLLDNNAQGEVNPIDDFSLIEARLKDIHAEVVTDYCRLCSENIKDTSNVSLYCKESNSTKIAEIINKIFPVKVAENDTLPQQICESCNENVKKHYQFFQTVLKANETLRAKFKPVESVKNNSAVDDNQLLTDILEGETSSISKTLKNVKHDLLDESKYYEPEYLDENDSEAKVVQNCRLCDLIIDNSQDAIIHSVTKHHIDNLYACIFCDYGFTTSKLLLAHFNSDHKNKFSRKFKCKVCEVNFETQQLLQKHICGNRFEPRISRFDCTFCTKTYTTAMALKKHKKTHTEGKNFACAICKKIFSDAQTLKDHEASHKTSKSCVCHICGKSLNRLSRLRKHLLSHNNNFVITDIHVCNLCKQAFESEESARGHQIYDHGGIYCIEVRKLDKVYRCEYCEKCFTEGGVLNQHRLQHTGDCPFVCHICKAVFSTFAGCATHKTTHSVYQKNSEEKDFPVTKLCLCEHCGKTYGQWSYLQMHRKLKHSTVDQTNTQNGNQSLKKSTTDHNGSVNSTGPVKCEDCNIMVDTYETLRQHRLLHHTQEYSCQKCEKSFGQKIQLDNHLKTHNTKKENKCPVCPKSFINSNFLVEHMKQHPTKKGTYSYIKPRSLLKTNNDRPHECDVCGISFVRLSNLKTHKETHLVKKTSNFVLMLDGKLDEPENTLVKTVNPTSEVSNTVVNDTTQSESMAMTTNVVPNIETANYFDLGNGNYILQGNTVNINGKDYLILPDNNQKPHENYEMLVDNTVNQPMIQNGEPYVNNTIMLMDTAENTYMMPTQPTQNDLIFTSDTFRKTITSESQTYIIGNEFMLNDPAFTVN